MCVLRVVHASYLCVRSSQQASRVNRLIVCMSKVYKYLITSVFDNDNVYDFERRPASGFSNLQPANIAQMFANRFCGRVNVASHRSKRDSRLMYNYYINNNLNHYRNCPLRWSIYRVSVCLYV